MSVNKSENNEMSEMFITKRDGKKQAVSFDKIIERLKNLSKDLKINVVLVAQKVISQIYNNIKTTELDELAAQICISLMSDNLDYGKLASNIIISNNHKNTSPSFSEAMTILYNNKNSKGEHSPLIAHDVYETIMKNKDKLNSVINYEHDYNFNYFAFKTLEKAYLLKVDGKVVERIQHLLMRVSIGIHKDDIKSAIVSYTNMSNKYFIHATPTLYHSGTEKNQLASCFLMGTDDSVAGIFKTITDCAHISKVAGGIGVHISNIRGKGSHIKGTNGVSNGIIPMAKVYNETARYINQCFRGDTLVYTKNGPKTIESVKENDEVITIDGSYKRVNEVIINNKDNENMYVIKTDYSSEEVYVTKEHEIYVLQNTENLSNTELINQLKNVKITGQFLPVDKLDCEKSYLAQPIPTQYNKSNINIHLCELYGKILANNTVELVEKDVYKLIIPFNEYKYYMGMDIIKELKVNTARQYI